MIKNNNHDIGEHRLFVFLRAVCFLGLFLYAPMIINNTMNGIYSIALIESGMFCIFLYLLYLIHHDGNLNKAVMVFTITILAANILGIILPTPYTIFGITASTILLIFVTLGKKNGAPIATAFTVFAISVFLYKYSFTDSDVPAVSQRHAIIAIMIVYIVSYFNEATKAEYEKALLEKNNELKRLSSLDGLTQIFNRRYFDLALEKEWNRSLRHKTELSIILCDIDHFKHYNDTNGHLQGDECIKKVAKCLEKCCMRSSDLVARYGGEEFIIILPRSDNNKALEFAKKIQKSIAQLAIEHPYNDRDYITLSIGISTLILTNPHEY